MAYDAAGPPASVLAVPVLSHETRQFSVRQVEVRNAGSFTLFLDDGYALDVFPDDSSSAEYWRLFKPYVDAPHFVVSGKGLEK